MMRTIISVAVLTLGMAAVGCSVMEEHGLTAKTAGSAAVAGPGLKDGDLAVPEDYRDWPVFLADIDKVDAKQIRDIYINPVGHQAEEGDEFPAGTIAVMEIWNPALNADGSLAQDSDGKLVKDELNLIYLMGKSTGAGAMIDPALRNGDWVYSSFKADGVTPTGADAAACRGCHIPQAEKDWVHRYDEYFAKR